MIRFEWSLCAQSKVCGLFSGEVGQFDIQMIQMKTSYLLVELRGKNQVKKKERDGYHA